jgi:hypothetical protein
MEWITAAAVATIVGVAATLITNGILEGRKLRHTKTSDQSKLQQLDDWENIKLDRSTLRTEVGNYLAADSERWRDMAKRSGIVKDARRNNSDPDPAAIAPISKQAESARDRMWAAYARIQLVAPDEVVQATLKCIRLSDDRNRSFAGVTRSPSNPEHLAVLRDLVAKTRNAFRLDVMQEDVATAEPEGSLSTQSA